MKPKLVSLVLLSVVMAACGGGGADSSTLSGRWSAQLFQAGGINCSDGGFLSVGSGLPTSSPSVTIVGGNELGEASSLIIESCTFSGVRDVASEIEFTSNDTNCAHSLLLTNISDTEADIFIDGRVPVPDPASAPTCSIDESGQMKKD